MRLQGLRAAWSGPGRRARTPAERIAGTLAIRRQASGLFVLALVSMGAVVSVLSCQTSGPEAAAPIASIAGKEPDVRVRVRTRIASLSLSAPAVVSVRSTTTGAGLQTLRAPIAITVSPRGFVTTDASGVSREWGPSADLDLQAATGDADRAVMIIDGVSYPGKLSVKGKWRESAQFFDVVSTLPMETYIAGVLQKELYDGWPRQAYEAQAIAARSYATHERDRARRSARPYDVESSTLDQAYGGMPTRTTAIEAARATRGMVLAYSGAGGGGVLRAYYSSCCGGRPASAAAIWPSSNGFEFNLAGPLQGDPRSWACQGAPVFSWEVVRKNDELVRRIRAWGRESGKRLNGLDRIRSIEPTSRNAATRPNGYTITDIRGQTFKLSAEEMRLACNEGDGTGPGSLPDVRNGPQLVRSNDLEFFVSPAPAAPSASLGVPAPTAGGDIRIRGHGYGHGVGMCQYCAKGFAEKGMDAPTMLRTFYPGVRIEKAY